jgi:sugar phosphate isomerase/epimerase
MTNRRDFLKQAVFASAALSYGFSKSDSTTIRQDPPFKISLAQWSVNRLLFSGELDNLDFPKKTKEHGIDAVEYVNQFFMDKAEDMDYLRELKQRCEDEGVKSVLIMCDGEGQLASSDTAARLQSVENHKKWVEAAKFLECHSIRVNAYTDITWSEDSQQKERTINYASDGLRHLCEFADDYDISVIIENHGGYSSDPHWLDEVIRRADHPKAGSLPDFGNFRIYSDDDRTVSFDSYKGTDILMPSAKGVSLKPTVWDDEGNQHELDYERMMKIVLSHDYHGYVGIEHGERDREWESIVEIRNILEELQTTLRG